MAKIIESYNVSKLDIINSRTSRAYAEMAGEKEIVKGAAIVMSKNNEGEDTEYSYIFCESGEIYGGNSGTVKNTVSDLIDLMTDEPEKRFGVTVRVCKSKSGRDFNSLVISEVV